MSLTARGSALKYVIGSCVTPETVRFWRGMIVLSKEATEMALMALPGLELYHEPTAPSLPAFVASR